MYKRLLIFIILNLLVSTSSYSNLEVKARTAILQDYHSGEIIFEKEHDIQL